jgi:hypothetical protein
MSEIEPHEIHTWTMQGTISGELHSISRIEQPTRKALAQIEAALEEYRSELGENHERARNLSQ